MDQIASVPAPEGTDAIWSWHAPLQPRCAKVVTFLFVYLQKALWTYPPLHLGVISWHSNNSGFNPSLAAVCEAAESCFHLWRLKQEQPTSGFGSCWWNSRNSFAHGVLQRNAWRQNPHYIVHRSGCLKWRELGRNTVFSIRVSCYSDCYGLAIHARLISLELHLFWNQQGWHKTRSPKNNLNQSGLQQKIKQPQGDINCTDLLQQ